MMAVLKPNKQYARLKQVRGQRTGRKKCPGQKKVYRFDTMLENLEEDRDAMKTHNARGKKGHYINSRTKQKTLRKKI